MTSRKGRPSGNRGPSVLRGEAVTNTPLTGSEQYASTGTPGPSPLPAPSCRQPGPEGRKSRRCKPCKIGPWPLFFSSSKAASRRRCLPRALAVPGGTEGARGVTQQDAAVTLLLQLQGSKRLPELLAQLAAAPHCCRVSKHLV